jgi:hypothetical protein
MSMLHVDHHAACPCPCCMSMSMLHVNIHAACLCPWCMSCPCYISMFMLHVHKRIFFHSIEFNYAPRSFIVTWTKILNVNLTITFKILTNILYRK